MNKAVFFAIIGTAMFLFSAGSAFAASPAPYSPAPIEPNPLLNVNATWSSFNSSWSPMEYYNGTGYQNISAEPNPSSPNYISINPEYMNIPQIEDQNASYGYWNKSGNIFPNTLNNPTPGRVVTAGNNEINGYQDVYISTNESLSNTVIGGGAGTTISYSKMPSNNIAYDYITALYSVEGPAQTGPTFQLRILNNSYSGPAGIGYSTTITTGQTAFFSLSLAQMQKIDNNTDFGLTVSNGISLFLNIQLPEGTNTYTVTLEAFAITTYPISIGQYANGSQIYQYTGNHLQLAKFSPTTKANVINSGYTESLSQPLQNATITQTPISSGNYIEQVEYQGSFGFPSAPDLTYGPANLTEHFNATSSTSSVSAAQTQILDINGVSYLSTISGRNGTVALLTAANPTSTVSFLQIVDYTQAQWDSISSPPGIFTIAGIEYYWWIAVGGLATLIGLAAAAKHAGTKADQERIRRGGR